jgi:transcriptional regulator with XRE-family HTH domain
VIGSSQQAVAMERLAEALRLIRVFHDVSQTGLATKLGVSKSFLSEIESGKKRPSLELLSQYAAEFDVPISSLLFFAESVAANGLARPINNKVAPKVVTLLNWISAARETSPPTRKPAQSQLSPGRKKTRFGS